MNCSALGVQLTAVGTDFAIAESACAIWNGPVLTVVSVASARTTAAATECATMEIASVTRVITAQAVTFTRAACLVAVCLTAMTTVCVLMASAFANLDGKGMHATKTPKRPLYRNASSAMAWSAQDTAYATLVSASARCNGTELPAIVSSRPAQHMCKTRSCLRTLRV